MGCDCNKTHNISMGCCVPVLGPIENYYTKYQTDLRIEEEISGLTGSSSGCCITPEEVDEKISAATDGMATEQWVEDKHYITGVDLSDYALKSEIPTVPTSNTAFTNDAGYLTEHQPIKTINGQTLVGTGDIEIGTGGTIDLSNYYTTAQTVNLVESAVTRVEGEIPTVPTSNTAFTNDAGYLTEHQSLSGKADVSAVTEISNSLTSHTSNTNVHVSSEEKNTWNGKVDSSTLNNYLLKSKIWCGTISEYNSIVNKDSETLYLIHE